MFEILGKILFLGSSVAEGIKESRETDKEREERRTRASACSVHSNDSYGWAGMTEDPRRDEH